jgi:ketosteroid isomerase-like protein
MREANDVRDSVLALLNAIANGDIATIDRLFSSQDEALVIGTDPEERWNGHAEIVRVFKSQMEEMGGGFPMSVSTVEAHAEGSVGWAAARPVAQLPDGTQLPIRITGVLHREDGDWKVVQWHVSVGAANEDTLGRELTI